MRDGWYYLGVAVIGIIGVISLIYTINTWANCPSDGRMMRNIYGIWECVK